MSKRLKEKCFLEGKDVLCSGCESHHLYEANYQQVGHVDYHDYDYEDYVRFGRVEKQLAG